MEYFETLPNYSPNIRINSYDIPLFGEFCLSNLLVPAALWGKKGMKERRRRRRKRGSERAPRSFSVDPWVSVAWYNCHGSNFLASLPPRELRRERASGGDGGATNEREIHLANSRWWLMAWWCVCGRRGRWRRRMRHAPSLPPSTTAVRKRGERSEWDGRTREGRKD